ncbi:NAD-binding protein [Irpex lacteus]|nr:NAD-binding protein [Irpex lacteus]
MPSYVVTGTSRGLGLGFVRAIASNPANVVFALVRAKSSASQLLDFVAQHPHKNVEVIEADNKDARALQLLSPSPDILEDDLTLYFKTNVVGPIHTINAFLPLLRAGKTKKCIVISTTVGSPKMTNANNFTNFAGYGISKAALNLAVAKFASTFSNEGVTFLSVNPGLVKTFQGTEEEAEAFYAKRTEINRKINPNFEGAITVEKSAGDILALTEKATIADSGKFVHRDGRDADYF